MATRIEDQLVEHMRHCPDKPRRPPGSETILPHFGHGDCPEFVDILASIELGPVIPFHEYMGWSPDEIAIGGEVYRDNR